MKEQIIEILSDKINPDLVSDLVESYISVKRSHILGDDESAISKSGKFVENVFRVLKFIRTGRILTEIKQREFNTISEELINSDGSKFSESIRILIPKISLSLIYETRKSGAVHVKEINPDFIDGKFVVGVCDWIMAEFLRLHHSRDPKIVSELMRKIIKEFVPLIQVVDEEKFVTANLDCDVEILIRLYDSESGLDRKELGKFMKNYFTPVQITRAITKLISEKSIFLTKSGKLILSDIKRPEIKNLISELS